MGNVTFFGCDVYLDMRHWKNGAMTAADMGEIFQRYIAGLEEDRRKLVWAEHDLFLERL